MIPTGHVHEGKYYKIRTRRHLSPLKIPFPHPTPRPSKKKKTAPTPVPPSPQIPNPLLLHAHHKSALPHHLPRQPRNRRIPQQLQNRHVRSDAPEEPIPQLDRHQRVHAVRMHGLPRIHVVDANREQVRQMLADGLAHDVLGLAPGRRRAQERFPRLLAGRAVGLRVVRQGDGYVVQVAQHGLAQPRGLGDAAGAQQGGQREGGDDLRGVGVGVDGDVVMP